jgi:hypothetical protein
MPYIVNENLEFVVRSTSFSPVAVSGGPAGTFTINAVLTNKRTERIQGPVKAVVKTLTKGNKLLSATYGNGGAGSGQAIDAGTDGALIPQESTTIQFRIGLATRSAFTFLVDVYGAAIGP